MHVVQPTMVLEIAFDRIQESKRHKSGYALRFPRIVSFRGADKRPEDATTVKEIVEMFKQQGKKAVRA